MKTSDSLNTIFNIPSTEVDIISKDGEVIVPQSTADEAIDHDYATTRQNLHNLLIQGQEALIHALDLAKSSEHPRAFEVVGELVSKLADVNGKLLDLTEKRQKLIEKSKQQTEPSSVTNNNAFFVGSTHELKKMIQDLNKGE